MPWQHSGVQGKRTWPIGLTRESLQDRWNNLLKSVDRASLFKESTDRTVDGKYKALWGESESGIPIAALSNDASCPKTLPYGYRSFDRQFVIADTRLLSRPREVLWQSHSGNQFYFATLFSQSIGAGPALSMSAYVPDLDFFRGSYGAKNILPLYRDAQAQQTNLHPALPAALKLALGKIISAEDIAAYLYAVLAHPGYTARFRVELENREVRVPVTLDKELFAAAVAIGRRLIYLHSYGERFAQGQSWPHGRARCTKAIATESLPDKFSYDEAAQTLHVGDGLFKPVALAVWEFEVSGLKVVQSWLGYRMKNRKGKKSSPLDDITPASWPPEFTSELLRLLHLLEETLEIYPQQAALLEQIIKGPLLNADQLGAPPDEYRKPPASHGTQNRFDI